ncbi:MAG: flagellar hook-associated protein FlgK [Thermoflexaceae bacterium]|nr:flagellar hook-associated protein FlgK [Thermoflexaceae bacterium]
MAGGMAGLYIGVSGLKAAQTALNTTGHNLSNIDTQGYTRQQITYSTSKYFNIGQNSAGSLQYGIGVNVQDVRRVRDEFLDKAYRQENGRTAFYESQYTAVEEVEALFGEMEGVKFEDSINDLWSSINEVAKNPGSTVTRTALVQSAVAFINRANAIYDGLVSYQKMLNKKVSDTVNRINELGSTIDQLNKKINYIESSGEDANDYRDERDKALDELASYVKIEYWETADSKVNINLEGYPFLTGNSFFKMDVQTIGTTGLYEPVWPTMDNRSVFAFNEEFNSINNNDIGELKGMLLARGNSAVNYQDVPVEPVREDFASDAEYDAAYDQYESDVLYYNTNIDNSVILSTMAGFDKLINGIVEAVNNVLCPETTTTGDITTTDGTVIPAGTTILNLDETAYGMDGKTVGVELFSRRYTERYDVKEYVDANGETQKIYVRNDKNSFGNESLYTLGNLMVNDKVLQDYQNIPLSLEDGSEDFATAEKLIDIWEVKFAALNPDKYAKEDFQSFYNSLVSSIANTGEVLYNMQQYQESMANELDNKRQESIGVASDEELTNMIRFQNAYNAASRYISVVSEMMEHLVTALGS